MLGYIHNKSWFKDMTSDEESFDRNVKEFDDPKSKRESIYNSAHWGVNYDAYNGLDLLKLLKRLTIITSTWRKTGYLKIQVNLLGTQHTI